MSANTKRCAPVQSRIARAGKAVHPEEKRLGSRGVAVERNRIWNWLFPLGILLQFTPEAHNRGRIETCDLAVRLL
jgi:hypothetical protein